VVCQQQASPSANRSAAVNTGQKTTTASSAPAESAATIKLPKAQSEKIKQIEERIKAIQTEAQRQIETLLLMRQNTLLEAALELHLSKSEFESKRPEVDKDGDVVLVPRASTPSP
jgi:hypothetical protein